MNLMFLAFAATALSGGSLNGKIDDVQLEKVSQQPICPLYQYQHNLPADVVESFCREWARENRQPSGGSGYDPPEWRDSGCDSPRLCRHDV